MINLKNLCAVVVGVILLIFMPQMVWGQETPIINVESYGANGSDSITDTRGIQDALNAARDAGGGTVVVPNGTYYTDKILFIYSDTTLHLDSGAQIIRKNIAEPMLQNYTGPVEGLRGKGYSNTKNITIEGGIWNGNVSGNSSNVAADLIRMYCANNVAIKNCTIKSVCGFHHLDMASVDQAEVSNVTFADFVFYSGTDYSTLETGADNNNSLNTTASITSEALQLDYYYDRSYPCKNLNITGCIFKNVLSGVGNHHVEGTADNVTISNNKFSNIYNTCINLYNFSTVSVSKNTATNIRAFARVYGGKACNITDNTPIKSFSGKNKYNMFRISNKAKLSINGNNMSGSGNVAIKLDSSSEATISQNTINDATSYAIAVNASTAIISGNVINNSGNVGIYFTKGHGRVEKNVITNPQKQGINISEKSTLEGITGNQIKNAKRDGILVGGYSTVAVIGGNSANKNIIDSSKWTGINIISSVVPVVSYNILSNTGAASLSLDHVNTKASLTNNTIKNSHGYGIYSSASKILVKENTIKKSTQTAICIKAGSSSIQNNKISDTKSGAGIDVLEKAKCSEISGNTIQSVNGNGIYVRDSNITNMSKNSIKDTKSLGICIWSGTVTMSDNQFSKIGDKSLWVNSGTAYLLSGNAKMLLKNDQLLVTGIDTNKKSAVKIPSKVVVGNVSYKVTAIKDSAFKSNNSIVSMEIGSNIQSIGKNAFKGCSKITSVIIKTKSLQESTIGVGAFSGLAKNCTVQVPRDKVSIYKSLLQKRGAAKNIVLKSIN